MSISLFLYKDATLTITADASKLIDKDADLLSEHNAAIVTNDSGDVVIQYKSKVSTESFPGAVWRNFIDELKQVVSKISIITTHPANSHKEVIRARLIQFLDRSEQHGYLFSRCESDSFCGILRMLKECDVSIYNLSDSFYYVLDKCLEMLSHYDENACIVVR